MRRYRTKPTKTSNPKKPKSNPNEKPKTKSNPKPNVSKIQSKRKTKRKSNPKPNVSKIQIQKKNQIQSYPKITGIRIYETVKQKIPPENIAPLLWGIFLLKKSPSMMERDSLKLSSGLCNRALFQHRKGSIDKREILWLVVVNGCGYFGFPQPNHNSIFCWND